MLPWAKCPDLIVPLRCDYSKVAIDGTLLSSSQRLLDAIRAEIPRYARPLANLVHLRTVGRFAREIRAAARRAGADWRDVTLANVSYDFVVARFGCSTVALATTDGPLLARNMDWWPEDLLAQASCQLQFQSAGVTQFTSAAWPGGIGVVTGLSRKGFAVALNAVLAAERFNVLGYPVLLFLRRVLEDAENFEQAVSWCSTKRLAAPALITIVGRRNDQRVVVERTPTRHALRRPIGDEPLITTNDFRSLEEPKPDDRWSLGMTTCHRYEALHGFLGNQYPRAVSDEEILFALTQPQVMQTITAQHIVIRPTMDTLQLFVPRHLIGTRESDLFSAHRP